MNGQTSIFNPAVNAAVFSADPDAFGCCSRYRECSDAGKCFNPSEELAAHCIYKQSLESGRIFYGKGADGFSIEEYREICGRVEALPPEKRQALEEVLINFCEYNRGTVRMTAGSGIGKAVEGLGIFKVSPLGTDFPRLCGFSALKELVKRDKVYSELYGKAKDTRKLEIA